MPGQRDIRETGVRPGTHDAMEQALARRRREDEEAAQRRRAHQRLYEAQFRRPKTGPIDREASLKITRRWLNYAFGKSRETPRKKVLRGSDGPFLNDERELTPEQVFRGPEERIFPVRTIVPPRTHVEIEPWILDAETLEAAFAVDDMTWPTWSTDPYSNLWASVGLILNDDDFQHVSYIIIPFHSFYAFQNCLDYF